MRHTGSPSCHKRVVRQIKQRAKDLGQKKESRDQIRAAKANVPNLDQQRRDSDKILVDEKAEVHDRQQHSGQHARYAPQCSLDQCREVEVPGGNVDSTEDDAADGNAEVKVHDRSTGL